MDHSASAAKDPVVGLQSQHHLHWPGSGELRPSWLCSNFDVLEHRPQSSWWCSRWWSHLDDVCFAWSSGWGNLLLLASVVALSDPSSGAAAVALPHYRKPTLGVCPPQISWQYQLAHWSALVHKDIASHRQWTAPTAKRFPHLPGMCHCHHPRLECHLLIGWFAWGSSPPCYPTLAWRTSAKFPGSLFSRPVGLRYHASGWRVSSYIGSRSPYGKTVGAKHLATHLVRTFVPWSSCEWTPLVYISHKSLMDLQAIYERRLGNVVEVVSLDSSFEVMRWHKGDVGQLYFPGCIMMYYDCSFSVNHSSVWKSAPKNQLLCRWWSAASVAKRCSKNLQPGQRKMTQLLQSCEKGREMMRNVTAQCPRSVPTGS